MAQQHLNSDSNGITSGATSLTCTMSAAVQVGDTIVVWCRMGAGGSGNPTDTIGNTYTVRQDDRGTTGLVVWEAVSSGAASAGGNIVTSPTQAAGRIGIAVHHLRGMSSTPFDTAPAITTGTSTNSFNTAQANEIIVAVQGGGSVPTPEADYGGANAESNGAGRIHTCYRTATVQLTGEQVTWDISQSNGAAAYKEAAGSSATRGRVSFAELEVPNLLTRGLVSFAELEVPNVATRGRISFAEFEAPSAPTRGRLSFAELEVPNLLTRGLLSFAEFEVPALVTRGLISWAELEVPTAPTRGLVSMMELETPNAPTRGLLSWVELQTPELGEAVQTTQTVAGRPMQGTIVYLMQLVGAVKKITRE